MRRQFVELYGTPLVGNRKLRIAVLCLATVDFEKTYYNYGDAAVLKRETYTAHFVFVVKDRVPNSMIPVNPLGLTITYFREDQAFQ